jgi:hypothetical protein
MMIRNACHLMTAVLLTCGVAAIAPATTRAQDVTVLPETKGPVTLVGCFLHEKVGKHERYVLASPRIGPVTGVAEPTCASTGSEQVLKLTEVHENHMVPSMLGRWVEINGELGRPRDGDDLRKLHIDSVKAVPVVVPRAAVIVLIPEATTPVAEPTQAIEAQPAAPQVTAISPVEERPVGTTGISKRLPHTASALPLTGLIGLFALSAGLGLRVLNRRRALGLG